VATRVLLWDFGDTLVDERWMLRAPTGCSDWPRAWADVATDHASEWNIGRATERDIFDVLSERTGLDVGTIERHAADCCRAIRFHSFAWRIARERRLPQALVTVNPDLFVKRVAKPYNLERHFDTIVVSCTEGTDDKTRLCEIALDRLRFDGARADALLIDNRQDLVRAWEDSGGTAYWYRGDDRFEADIPRLVG
jgi:hypothetical protein